MPADDDANRPAGTWNPSAALAAWVLPGLGHALLGQTRRGLVIGVTIAALWLSGLLIGGVGSIDRGRHPYWFLGQMLAGPSLAVHYVRSTFMVEAARPADLDRHTPGRLVYEPAFGHPNEQGVLYTALAGLLNLLAVIDVLYREPHRVPTDVRPRPAGGEGAPR